MIRYLQDWLWRIIEHWLKTKFIFSEDARGKNVAIQSEWNNSEINILLHVGCGGATKINTSPGFQSENWREVRLDINPGVNPDIVGSILDMSMIPTKSVDGVFSSHTLEHLYPHEVPIALTEIRRVLKSEGIFLVTVPDLQSVAQLIVEDKFTECIYISAAGPIRPLDILYGHEPSLAMGNLYMAHHGGFTLTTLVGILKKAGFVSVAGMRRNNKFDLWVLATEQNVEDAKLRELAAQYFPF
ncbi:SAM-dependent methyltransferase [Gammaproteobacteria bacterium]